MGEGINHILAPISAPWCAWTMLALLLCAVLAEWSQPGVISQAWSSLIAHTDRTFKESPATVLGQFFITLFRIGTAAMLLCLCYDNEQEITGLDYTIICGWVLAIVLIKMLCNITLVYTFSLFHEANAAYEHYGNICTLAALLLYPSILVVLQIGSSIAAQITLIAVTGLFILAWLYRSARLFVHTPRAILYLLMAISTLEILPLGALYYVSEITIRTL